MIEFKREFLQLYQDALRVATEATTDNPNLLKITFQALYWELIHDYLIRKRVKKKLGE